MPIGCGLPERVLGGLESGNENISNYLTGLRIQTLAERHFECFITV